MTKENEPKKSEWYKHGWGLVVAILFFPYFIVWYAWAKSKWGQGVKIAVTAVVAVVMLPIIIGVATTDTTQQNANTNKDAIKDQAATSQQQETTTTEPATTTPTKPAEPAKPAETVSQKNAVRKAKDYLSYTAFSYGGLIAQLEYEKFSPEDAKYGADNSGADWMEQAAKKAKDYMEYSSFSRGSLIAQLEYDKFTPEQAAHGADAVGL